MKGSFMLVYAEEIQEVILQTKRKTGQNFVLWISGPISTVVQAFYLVECHIKNQDQAIRRNRSILFLQNVLKSNYICQDISKCTIWTWNWGGSCVTAAN